MNAFLYVLIIWFFGLSINTCSLNKYRYAAEIFDRIPTFLHDIGNLTDVELGRCKISSISKEELGYNLGYRLLRLSFAACRLKEIPDCIFFIFRVIADVFFLLIYLEVFVVCQHFMGPD